MAETIKLISQEIALSTANTVDSASLVRLYNDSGSAVLITRAAGSTIGTCTMGNGDTLYMIKQPSETLASNVAIKAVSVAYT